MSSSYEPRIRDIFSERALMERVNQEVRIAVEKYKKDVDKLFLEINYLREQVSAYKEEVERLKDGTR